MVTKSQSGIVKPIKRLSLHTSSLSPILKSPFIALKDPYWCNAMYDEYNALVKNGTWTLVSRPSDVNLIVDSLHKEFDKTNLGALNYFLGIFDVRHPTGLFLSQKKYALQLLERNHMVNCNPSRTLVDSEAKLGPNDVPVQDPTLYRSLAGGLQYLTFTRPDFSYAVQQICLYMHDPREPHFGALKRILCYVQGTMDLGLHLYASATTSLVGYIDADWAGCPSTRMSTLGYCVYLGDNLLSRSAKRQHTISRSSVAEYWGVANVVAETAWVYNFLRELHHPLMTATLVYSDNVNAVYISTNPIQHQRTKHIEIDIHFVRDIVKVGHVRVLHVPSRFQYADIFTKGLPSALFEDFRSSLNVLIGFILDSKSFPCNLYILRAVVVEQSSGGTGGDGAGAVGAGAGRAVERWWGRQNMKINGKER
nr:ribonuclease H-like domain-containing protein [Tanacetum cinerariifolium]